MRSWRDKVNEVIAELSMAAYLKANTKKDGTKYKKHRSYTTPEIVDELVACIGDHNHLRGEHRAKQIMCWEIHPYLTPNNQ